MDNLNEENVLVYKINDLQPLWFGVVHYVLSAMYLQAATLLCVY